MHIKDCSAVLLLFFLLSRRLLSLSLFLSFSFSLSFVYDLTFSCSKENEKEDEEEEEEGGGRKRHIKNGQKQEYLTLMCLSVLRISLHPLLSPPLTLSTPYSLHPLLPPPLTPSILSFLIWDGKAVDLFPSTSPRFLLGRGWHYI